MEWNKKRGRYEEKDPPQFILSDDTVIKQAYEHSEESRDEIIHDSGLFIIDPIVKFRGVSLKQLVDALNSKILYDQLDSENKCSDLVEGHHTSFYKTYHPSFAFMNDDSSYRLESKPRHKRIFIPIKMEIIRHKIWKRWGAYKISQLLGVSVNRVCNII